MNRKLLNGLLVLAVATGGVVTFTSCKDEDFRTNTLLTETSLQAQIDAIRSVSNEQFQRDLEKWLNNWTSSIEGSGFADYPEMVQAAAAMYQIYQDIMNGNITGDTEKYVQALYDWMFNNEIKASDWYDLIFTLAGRATSVEVNDVTNPVFGSVNLPLDVKTTVVASYLYYGQQFNFPSAFSAHVNDASLGKASTELAEIIVSLNPEDVALTNNSFTEAQEFGNMGGAVITINPSSNNYADKSKYTVELVKSNGEVVFTSAEQVAATAEEGEGTEGEAPAPVKNYGKLSIAPYEGILYFGGHRASEPTGVYALNVDATPESYADYKIDLDKTALKDALKQAWDKKDLSSASQLVKVVWDNMKNKLPAYAVRVSWQENVVDPETGNVMVDEDEAPLAPITNSVYSDFDIAAAVVHPLSYGTNLGAVIPSGKTIPVFHNTLVEYLDKLGNKLHFEFSIDPIENITVEFNVKVVTEDNGDSYVYFQVYDEDGNLVDADPIKIDYNDGGLDVSEWDLNALLDAVLKAVGMEFESAVNYQMLAQLNEQLDKVNEEIMKLNNKVDDYLTRLKEDNKLEYAQKLVNIYNRIAEFGNRFLADPNKYLQVVMGYYVEGDGAHFMSNDMKMAETVMGNSIDLITTSYNGDMLVPSYKKYVAITAVVNDETADLAALNTAAGLNKVFDGQESHIKMNLPSELKGKKLRLTYMSVDYRGEVSLNNYYMIAQ